MSTRTERIGMLRASGEQLRFVHVVQPMLADRFQALSGVPSVLPLSGNGAHPSEMATSMNRWWSRAFRDEIRDMLGPFLRIREASEDSGWRGADFVRVAGSGLISDVRDEVGFGLDVLSLIEEHKPRRIELVTDNRSGLRLGGVLGEVSRLVGVKAMLTFDSSAGPKLRMPISMAPKLDQLAKWHSAASARWTRLLGWYGGTRSIAAGARVQGKRATVAFFESTSTGWAYNLPLVNELLGRGFDAIPLVTSLDDVQLVRQAVQREPLLVLPRPVPAETYQWIRRHLRSASFIELPEGIVQVQLAESLLRTIIGRRLERYLPAMQGAIVAARFVTEVLGARATHQFNHHSPVGRAFMHQAQLGGAHTFATPHGSDEPDPPSRWSSVTPDTTLAWGPSTIWTRPDVQDVRITGNHLVELRINDVKRAQSCATHHDPLVLVAFGRPGRIMAPDVFASAIRLTAAAAALRPGFRFVAKIHPGDTREFWLTALRSNPGAEAMTLESGDLYGLMGRARVVLTMHSTAGGEAICAGLPVICINSHVDPASGEWQSTEVTPEYLATGAAYRATDADTLCAILDHLLTHPGGSDRLAARRAEYARTFMLLSGDPRDAVIRVADAITQDV